MRKAIPFVILSILGPSNAFTQQTEMEPDEETSRSTNWTYGETLSHLAPGPFVARLNSEQGGAVILPLLIAHPGSR